MHRVKLLECFAMRTVWIMYRAYSMYMIYETMLRMQGYRCMVHKEEVVCMCAMCICAKWTPGETSQGLPSLHLGPYYLSSMALALSPPHPSPCFPTLIVHHSPAHRPLVQQPSQRTSWYSQAPTVEEKNISPYTLESLFPTFLYGCNENVVMKVL